VRRTPPSAPDKIEVMGEERVKIMSIIAILNKDNIWPIVYFLLRLAAHLPSLPRVTVIQLIASWEWAKGTSWLEPQENCVQIRVNMGSST